MLTNIHTGERIHIKNLAYENIKVLRGNNPNLLYQYICLMRSNRVYDYLNIFPQYKNMFSKFYKNYTDFIQNIYNAYVNYYIKKDRNTKISKKYLYHIHTLHHQIYIPSLCNKQKTDSENFLTETTSEFSPIQKGGYVNQNNSELDDFSSTSEFSQLQIGGVRKLNPWMIAFGEIRKLVADELKIPNGKGAMQIAKVVYDDAKKDGANEKNVVKIATELLSKNLQKYKKLA
jgi:hypothetical protein